MPPSPPGSASKLRHSHSNLNIDTSSSTPLITTAPSIQPIALSVAGSLRPINVRQQPTHHQQSSNNTTLLNKLQKVSPTALLHLLSRKVLHYRMHLLACSVLWIILSIMSSHLHNNNSVNAASTGSSSSTAPTQHVSWESEEQLKVTSVGDARFKSNFPLTELRQIYLPDLAAKNGTTQLTVHDSLVSFTSAKTYPQVRYLPTHERKRILVTGGAGFVGSHLVDRLMLMGNEVIVLDNFFTGSKRNVLHWIGHPNFELIRHDVVDPFMIEVDEIYHLACPASPPHYQYNPIKTVKTSVMGTINMLGLAKRVKAKFLLTSTSEVYGDPNVTPQPETYWGNVNPIGPRACYDEGKRVAETLTYSYAHQADMDVRVARIFNTFGPRMNQKDGRVVSNFIMQALQGQDMTVYGTGEQTRSFQFVHDLVDGLIALMGSTYTQPVNIGNPQEYTIQEFAEMIRKDLGGDSQIVHLKATEDDPQQRRPDITRATQELHWKPNFPVHQGIRETVEYFQWYINEEMKNYVA